MNVKSIALFTLTAMLPSLLSAAGGAAWMRAHKAGLPTAEAVTTREIRYSDVPLTDTSEEIAEPTPGSPETTPRKKRSSHRSKKAQTSPGTRKAPAPSTLPPPPSADNLPPKPSEELSPFAPPPPGAPEIRTAPPIAPPPPSMQPADIPSPPPPPPTAASSTLLEEVRQGTKLKPVQQSTQEIQRPTSTLEEGLRRRRTSVMADEDEDMDEDMWKEPTSAAETPIQAPSTTQEYERPRSPIAPEDLTKGREGLRKTPPLSPTYQKPQEPDLQQKLYERMQKAGVIEPISNNDPLPAG